MEQYFFIVWIVICAISLIVEVSVSGLVSIWIAASALVCIGLSFIDGLPWWGEIIIFIGLSLLFLILTRPLVNRIMKNKKELKTNLQSLIGNKYKVVKTITKDSIGELKINGVYWDAESFDNQEILEGKIVEVIEIKGNKLIVKEVKNNG